MHNFISAFCYNHTKPRLWRCCSVHVQCKKMATRFKREMQMTQEELAEAKVPLHLRDYCAHHFVTLTKCRKDHYYLPWHCKKEKHAWDECEFQDYLDRVRQKREQKLGIQNS